MTVNTLFYRSLEKIYNLESLDYFQTGILYFDTSIIDESTKKDLINLAEKFPLSTTNEQGIMNLYFKDTKNLYSELVKKIDSYTSYFYWLVENEKIIITKQLKTKYK